MTTDISSSTASSPAADGHRSSGRPLLVGTGITKQFGGLTAVDNVDIEVGHGEMVGLIGPNGSGKTTLFDCLSRVQDTTSGTVTLDGLDITRKRPHRVAQLGLSRTFQLIRVYPALTVLENMELSVQWREVGFRRLFTRSDRATRERADQLIDFLMLNRLRDEQASTLSGGQRRLLEIGMAMMSEPKIVLLDEATSGVNPSLVEQIKERLTTINQEQGVAFLLVEHDIRFVKDLCRRVVVLDYGAKLAEGSPDDIMSNHAVVEAYFGDSGQDEPSDGPSDDEGWGR